MRVAFINRAPEVYPGGDVLSIQETITALKKIGTEGVYVHGQWTAADLVPFDLVHVKHINFSWSVDNFRKVWDSGKPYVVQPVFYPTANLGNSAEGMAHALCRAARIIPYTNIELAQICRRLDIEVVPSQVAFIPNGTHYRFHYVDGRPEYKSVMTGGARSVPRSEEFKAAVHAVGREPFLAIGMPPDEMPLVYRQHGIFVSMSDSDRMSRMVGEALCSGCRVISSIHNWGNEWYPGIVTVNPQDQEALAAAILNAKESRDWDYSPNWAARALTWDVVAVMLTRVYREVLNA